MDWFRSTLSVPRWLAAGAALLALVVGAVLGTRLHHDKPTEVRHGVVDSLDDGGAICLRGRRPDSKVECYRAPGVGVKVGDEIGYRVQSVDLDPDDPGKGSELVLVWDAPVG